MRRFILTFAAIKHFFEIDNRVGKQSHDCRIIMNKKLKVLVADPISPKGVELLKQKGFETVEAYGSTPDKVKELIADADAVIVR